MAARSGECVCVCVCLRGDCKVAHSRDGSLVRFYVRIFCTLKVISILRMLSLSERVWVLNVVSKCEYVVLNVSEIECVEFECGVSGAEINYTYFCVYMSIPSTCLGSSVFSVG